MGGFKVPEYYRDRPGAGRATQQAVATAQQPQPSSELEDAANVGSVGPLRALHGQRFKEVEIPCAVSPAGQVNRPVELVRNDFPAPMFVRVRLARNSTEGRIGIGTSNEIRGQNGSRMEWVDFTTQPGRMYEVVLQNGESLFAIGSWPGVVPLSVFLTMAAWNPGLNQ